MQELSFIKECYKKFLSSSKNGNFFEESNISFIKSGSSSRDMNVCIIDKISDFAYQKELFKNNFNVNGFMLSLPSSKFIVQNISDQILYCGKVGLMVSNGLVSDYKNNNIEKINSDRFDDFINFISNERKIEKEIIEDMVEKNSNDMHIYLSYEDGSPIGAGYAIEHENNIFILDTIVKDEKRNAGILSAIGEISMNDATKNGISNFLSIVSSNYSQKVAEKMSYQEAMILDFWITRKS